MKILIAIIAVTIIACTPNIALVTQYQKDDAATLKFYDRAGDAGLRPYLVVDNEMVGEIMYREESDFKVSPGEHVLNVFFKAMSNPFKNNFAASKTYYFDTNDTFRALGEMNAITEINASEFNQLKEGNKKLEGR
jgi:hypothetical protein